MHEALWELLFMLVILKIPVVYLCCVVLWAVRAEPRPPEPACTPRGETLEPRPPLGGRPRRPRLGPHGRPTRTYARRTTRVRTRIDR